MYYSLFIIRTPMKYQDFSSDKNLVSGEDIRVVMATSVSANRKRASQHLAIGVYIINRILNARLWKRILSSRVQLDISRVRCAHSLEDKIRIHARACCILYFSRPKIACARLSVSAD